MNSPEQRRANPRTRTLLEGCIVYNNGVSRMKCTVRDLSTAGARLVFAQQVKVPAEFELQIPGKRLARRAQVIWYDGQTHGIMFLDGDQKASDSVPSGRPKGGSAVSSGPSDPRVADILEEARQRIAERLAVPADTIRLTIDIVR